MMGRHVVRSISLDPLESAAIQDRYVSYSNFPGVDDYIPLNILAENRGLSMEFRIPGPVFYPNRKLSLDVDSLAVFQANLVLIARMIADFTASPLTIYKNFHKIPTV
jgi:hypothetical protein